MAPSTLRLAVSLLRSVCAGAVLDRRITSSPVVRITLPPRDAERVVPLTVEQVRELAAAMPPRNRAMVLAQAGLGLRVGELLALRVDDVDFLRRAVRVECQIARLTQDRQPTKTPRSRRVVPLPQVVADVLARHLAEFGNGTDGSLFATTHGNHYRSDYYDALFRQRVALTTLPAGTSSHDLRHHYASVLLAAGESVVAVAERLGHENAGLVLSTYGHLMPDSEDRTRRAVDDAWRAPSVPPSEGQAV